MAREEIEEISEAISYIKSYRKLDEYLYDIAPKGSEGFYATKKCLRYWDMAIEALEKEAKEFKEVKDVIVARPKCMYCKHATLKVTDPPCLECYCTANRPNFKPNETCKKLYSKIKAAEEKSKPKYMTEESYKEWLEEMNE